MRAPAHFAVKGFSLIELMVAMTLGLLLSIGIVTLFGATSKTNKVQDALARLQENGRYAMTRMTDDLRMVGGQYCAARTARAGPRRPTVVRLSRHWRSCQRERRLERDRRTVRSPTAADCSASRRGPSGRRRLSAGPGRFPARLRLLGRRRLHAGGAGPAGRRTEFRAKARRGLRVRGADVLTIRYQRGTGWNFAVGAGAAAEDRPASGVRRRHSRWTIRSISPSAIARCCSSCGGGQISRSRRRGNTLTPTGLLRIRRATSRRQRVGSFDVRVFNFSKDFITVTYYLAVQDRSGPRRPAV